MTTTDLLLRILVAAVLGGLVGLERELSDQAAGLRTHILVALGACLFTLVGAYGVEEFGGGEASVRFDPTRIAAQVVTGIGFLGAGAILREGLNIKGLTTAAALWVTAAIGVAVALGYWVGATATVVAALLALFGLKRFERFLLPRLRRGLHRFTITMAPDLRLASLAEVVESHSGRVEALKIVTLDSGERLLVGYVKLPVGVMPDVLAETLADVPGVTEMEWG